MIEINEKKLSKLENKGKIITNNNDSPNLLEINNLKTYFPVYGGIFRRIKGYIKAVDNVSFTLKKGEIFGLVGESGCGKSTIGRSIVRLYKPNHGDMFLNNSICTNNNEIKNYKINLSKLSRKEILPFRKNIQMIFQDPFSSLNPRYTVMDIIEEPLKIHISKNRHENEEKVFKLLKKVGLSEEHAFRFPHEFSGGQRQRIGIARALATNPELIIADEPVSALDVSIQAQVINLIQDLQEEFKMTYLFIAHDLSVVRHITQRVAIMYLGNIVEIGNVKEIYNDPRHPYTKALLSSIPSIDPKNRSKKQTLTGEVPSPMNKPSGCSFHTRCPIAKDICKKEEPLFVDINNDQKAKCFFTGS
jgi:oligopeptide/dipeptide ABC transporter ATP-binding protein